MHPLLQRYRDEIAALCARAQVLRLDVFGSAARGEDFDPSRSDVDFLVEFDRSSTTPTLGSYFDLREKLAELLGRPVDLVMAGSVRNPFIKASIERSRQAVYGT